MRARNPFVPAIHPLCPSTNRTEFSRSLVPLVCPLHVTPPSSDRSTVPPLPTAIRLSPPSGSSLRRLGTPPITASDQEPPRFTLRHTFPPSPTTTIVQPRATTSRSGLFPIVLRAHAAPPFTER